MNSERRENETLEQLASRRLDYLQTHLPNTISSMIRLELVRCDEAANDYVIKGHPAPWMVNFHGTLHGGMCATIVDQAMGFVAHCVKRGDGTAPTVELQVSYHRPLNPGGNVLVNIHVISVTNSLMRLSCEAYQADNPAKVCLTATATYFNKQQK